MKTNKKGISLIVLVITIIVLAILAATVIISIVNTGIINSAKDAVEAQKLGQVRDIASVAWGHALIDPSISTPEQYLNYIISILKGEGYTDAEIGKYTIVADVNGVTVDLEDTETDEPVIPEYAGLTITKDTPNVTFTKADGVTPGDPDNIEDGDIVIYGDYEYRYNYEYCEGRWDTSEINGWAVKLKSDCFEKTTVGELCGNIYGKPLVSMSATFVEVVWDESGFLALEEFGASIIAAPKIPTTVEYMKYTFDICTNLVTAPAIPSSVTDMSSTFAGCRSLTTAPDMSRATSVTDMNYTFSNCTSLTTAPDIPSSVTDMSSTFAACTSLTGTVQINSSIVSIMESCFYNITNSLTVKVPENSTTYTTITTVDLASNTITIETF